MSEDKNTLLRNWIICHQKIEKIKEELKPIKQQQKDISVKLKPLMKGTSAINTNVGEISLKTKTVKKPYSEKEITRLIYEYYRNNENEAKRLCEFIIHNRIEEDKDHIIFKS